MKTDSVKIEAIREAGFRSDPSYHLSEGVEVKRMVSRSPYSLKTVGDVTSNIFIGNRAKRVYVTNRDHGIPFLSSSDILKADLENVKLASAKYTPEIEQMRLKKGWTLISRSGTIGNCAFANAKHAQKLASEDVIRACPNNILRAGVLYAYLASQYGHSLLTQGTFGAVIQHIEPAFVASLPIPMFPEEFQKEVDGMIQESARLREEAADALGEAKSFFDDKFQINVPSNKFSSVTIQSIHSSQNHRFEANYYGAEGAKYEKLITENFKHEPLNDFFFDISRPDIFKRKYVSADAGLMFFGSSELFMATPHSNKFVSKKTAGLESLILQEGWVLLPRSGTIGDVAYATSQHAQKLASEDVIRLKPNNILRGAYAYGFLLSQAGKAMLQRAIFGSVIQHIEPPMLKFIPVPLFEEKFEEIANLVISANKKLGRAGELELEAISMVEAEIEKWSKE